MRHFATIQWKNNNAIENNMQIAVGEDSETNKDDKEIFYYFENYDDLNDVIKKGHPEWKILKIR